MKDDRVIGSRLIGQRFTDPKYFWFQVERVARARGLSEERVRSLVEIHTEPRTLGILGEPRVKILELNLALEEAR